MCFTELVTRSAGEVVEGWLPRGSQFEPPQMRVISTPKLRFCGHLSSPCSPGEQQCSEHGPTGTLCSPEASIARGRNTTQSSLAQKGKCQRGRGSPRLDPERFSKPRQMAEVPPAFFFFSPLFRAAPLAYGGSQARGRIGAAATSPHHSHSHARSEPCLQPTPQLTATPDP